MTARHLNVLKLLLPAPYECESPELDVELNAVGMALDAVQDNAALLLNALVPENVPALLPLWEEAYGLPDRCDLGITPSMEARFAAVNAKRFASADFSIPFLINYAEKLGYPGTTITRVRMATCADPCNTPLYGEKHRALLDVHVLAERPVRYTTCADPCSLPLKMYDDMRIECAFRKIELAHVLFRFFYGE